MIQLPFVVDSPGVAGTMTLLFSLMLFSVLYAYKKDIDLAKRIIDTVMTSWLGQLPEADRFRYFNRVICIMGSFFMAMALFLFSVASGILKSKERERITIEQFIEQYESR